MKRRGFTLVELLTVIAIIGLLMALLMPAINAARVAARKARARADVKQIEVAIKSYFNDFRAMPFGDGTLDGNKLKLLTGENARKTVYYEASVDTAAGVKDPWGSLYVVAVDQVGDNTVTAGKYGTLKRTVAVWSVGKNGVQDAPTDNNNDDIVSWK